MHCGKSARLVMGWHFKPAPWPTEPAKQVPNGRGTMPQQHAWVGLHRLGTLRLRWDQTMRHVVNECPLTCFDGGISEIHLAQDAAFNWLLRQNLRSWKANDSNNNILQMSSVMYVIIYLKNTREKHSTENKPPQTTAFCEKPTTAAL